MHRQTYNVKEHSTNSDAANDLSVIPAGHFCYSLDTNAYRPNHRRYTRRSGLIIAYRCPYWSLLPERPEREDGWCHYLGLGDKELADRDGQVPGLWNEIKQCAVHRQDGVDNDHEALADFRVRLTPTLVYDSSTGLDSVQMTGSFLDKFGRVIEYRLLQVALGFDAEGKPEVQRQDLPVVVHLVREARRVAETMNTDRKHWTIYIDVQARRFKLVK